MQPMKGLDCSDMPELRKIYEVLPRGVKYYHRVSSRVKNQSATRERFSISALGRHEHGLTLIEMVVTIALASILMAMTAGALSYYFSAKALETSTRELTSQIREAQTLAVSTGNTYRIDFTNSDGKSYQVQYRERQGSDLIWINVRGTQRLPGDIEFSAVPSFGGNDEMEFYPRGTTETGQMVVHDRYGRSRVLSVNGETANVSVN